MIDYENDTECESKLVIIEHMLQCQKSVVMVTDVVMLSQWRCRRKQFGFVLAAAK